MVGDMAMNKTSMILQWKDVTYVSNLLTWHNNNDTSNKKVNDIGQFG